MDVEQLGQYETDRVKVVVRVRPFIAGELKDSPLYIKSNAIQVNIGDQPRVFQYDCILPQSTSQHLVYNEAASDVVYNFTQGMNGCILCYGQTSSGKTYTCGLNEPISDGIVYRSLHNAFLALSGKSFDLVIQFVQIYNEKISNLIKPSQTDLQLHEVNKNDFQLSNCDGKQVHSFQEAIFVIQNGLKNRKVAPTLQNVQSSRAHTILQLHLRVNTSKTSYTQSKLQILDLAGSERIAKSHSEGDRFMEAININQSLSHLGKTVSSLSQGRDYVPVRSSLLTKVLSTTLMQNCRTVLIATLCPTTSAAYESLSTLQFAKSCREIEQTVKFNRYGEDGQCEHQALQELSAAQRLELAEAVDAAGLMTKQKYTANEVRRVLYQQLQKYEQQTTAEVEHKVAVEKLGLEADVRALRRRLSALKTSREACVQLMSPPQRAVPFAQKPKYITEEALKVFELIRAVGRAVQAVDISATAQATFKGTAEVMKTLNLTGTAVEQNIGGDGADLAAMAEFMRQIGLYNKLIEAKIPPPVIDEEKKPKQAPKQHKSRLPAPTAFAGLVEFKQYIGQLSDSIDGQAKLTLERAEEIERQHQEVKQMEIDFYGLLALHCEEMYKFSKYVESLELQ